MLVSLRMPSLLLPREEYVEQAYFFRTYRERIEDNVPAQEVLVHLQEELLATTRLPMAVGFLSGEMMLHGRIGEGMGKLSHYFTPFQMFVVQKAEDDDSKFEMQMALRILEKEAEYRSGDATPPALFIYQFECIARNRLGYDDGLKAVAADGFYDDRWRQWILWLRRQLGTVDFADLIYRQSGQFLEDVRRANPQQKVSDGIETLFGTQEGRIAKAHRRREPLYMFAALQRHLGYPTVPRPRPPRTSPLFEPQVDLRFQRMEARLNLLEQETQGGIDLTEFLKQGPPSFEEGSDI